LVKKERNISQIFVKKCVKKRLKCDWKCDKINVRILQTSQCDLCAYYWIDEEDGTGECQVNLDEDDLARMLSGSSDSCPYFQMDDEYKIVRKQM